MRVEPKGSARVRSGGEGLEKEVFPPDFACLNPFGHIRKKGRVFIHVVGDDKPLHGESFGDHIEKIAGSAGGFLGIVLGDQPAHDHPTGSL